MTSKTLTLPSAAGFGPLTARHRFGNYIGERDDAADEPEEDEVAEDVAAEEEGAGPAADLMEVDDGPASTAVVLHEDKQYYPSAQQVYGPDVETLVQEEDTQALDEPIIAPVVEKKFAVQDKDLPKVRFERQFMSDLMNYPEQVRNVTIAGHLHHGKTAFMDMLVLETHELQEKLDKRRGKRRREQLRYTDTHFLERERGVSIKASPMSLVLSSTRRKSYLFNLIDTPGHVNFVDEAAASMRITDGVVLVVDVVEGVQATTELVIKHAIEEGIPMVLVVNKMDRLILELKMLPDDAYLKLKHVIEQVNNIINENLPGSAEKLRLSPEKGNVAFACSSMNWCFTLQSFAKFYRDTYPSLESEKFALRLWGDIYFNPSSRKFTREPVEHDSMRAFNKFILEPIYKLYSHTTSDSPSKLKDFLAKVNISLKPMQLKADADELLRLVCDRFFGPAHGFVDMVIQHIPSPQEASARIVDRYYTGPTDTKIFGSMKAVDQNGPLVMHVTRLFNTHSAASFSAFARVMSGTVHPGDQVRILGEAYTPDDEEDSARCTVSDTWIAETRYHVSVSGVPAGSLVLLGGVDESIIKTATIVSPELPNKEEPYIFSPIKHMTTPVFKLAIEPLNPSELPKMLNGLRKIQKSFPLVTSKVEESGEHVLIGTGELGMDCVLHDLRKLYAEIEVKVSDPVTRFCETAVEQTDGVYYCFTPNKHNKVTIICEPLEPGVAEAIERGEVNIKDPVRKIGKFFEERFGWDLLASRNIWAFGPDDMGPNVLVNDTLPSEVDQKVLRSVRETMKQGFQWATREGPLCEEPIRGVKFRVVDMQLANDAIQRGGGQIIPTMRRACYASLLRSGSRLMEPVFHCSVICSADSVQAVYSILARRRGHVLLDNPIPGTPLYQVRGLLPVIDSFGFETDLRIQAQGQASVSLYFERWDVVPGNPLDGKSDKGMRALEPAAGEQLARDFMLKTRRRKGLVDEVRASKFVEREIVQAWEDKEKKDAEREGRSERKFDDV